MNPFVALMMLVMLCCAAAVKDVRNPPKVQLYSRGPGEFGKDNVLICHVSDFHPPDISITLMKNDEELPNSNQTDLAFSTNWHFHLIRSAAFIPQEGDKLICRVEHGTAITKIAWDPNM